MQRFFSYLWLLIPLVLSPIHLAHAYLDPGTGSYAIQMVIGVLFGTTYALKSFGGNLMTGLKSRFRKGKEPIRADAVEDTETDGE